MKAIIVLQSGKVLNKDLPKFFDDLPTNAKKHKGNAFNIQGKYGYKC